LHIAYDTLPQTLLHLIDQTDISAAPTCANSTHRSRNCKTKVLNLKVYTDIIT